MFFHLKYRPQKKPQLKQHIYFFMFGKHHIFILIFLFSNIRSILTKKMRSLAGKENCIYCMLKCSYFRYLKSKHKQKQDQFYMQSLVCL
jgi:hypothetical protein